MQVIFTTCVRYNLHVIISTWLKTNRKRADQSPNYHRWPAPLARVAQLEERLSTKLEAAGSPNSAPFAALTAYGAQPRDCSKGRVA